MIFYFKNLDEQQDQAIKDASYILLSTFQSIKHFKQVIENHKMSHGRGS